MPERHPVVCKTTRASDVYARDDQSHASTGNSPCARAYPKSFDVGGRVNNEPSAALIKKDVDAQTKRGSIQAGFTKL